MRFLAQRLGMFGATIEAVLDAPACAVLVGELGRSFVPTGTAYPRGYRDNDRAIFDDPALAQRMFARVASELPSELEYGGATWRLDGLNSRFRACRYRGGQAFCIHRDGPYVPDDSRRSLLTLQIYLDDAAGMTGGHTRFYTDHAGTEVVAAIAPRAGDAIAFDHRVWHDGEAVTAGEKHVVRTDVMYRRITSLPRVDDPRVLGRHRGYAWRVIDAGDGTIASGGRDGLVRCWRDGEPLATYALGSSVTALVRATDDRLWCGTRAGRIAVIDDGETTIRECGAAILALAAMRDGRVVAATARGELVEPHTGRVTHAHDGWAWSVIVDSEAMISCGDDGRIVRDGETLAELDRPLRAIAKLPSGALVAGGTDGTLHLLGHGDRRSWRGHTGAITSLAVASDGTWASSSEDGTVQIWRDDRAIRTLEASGDFVTCVAFSGSGDRLFTTGYDGAVTCYGAIRINTSSGFGSPMIGIPKS